MAVGISRLEDLMTEMEDLGAAPNFKDGKVCVCSVRVHQEANPDSDNKL